MLTTRHVAEKLGITPRRVQKLIADGRLKAVKLGRDWMIDPASVKSLVILKPGRPKLTT